MSRGMKGESVVAQGARRVTEVLSDSARGVKGWWSSRRSAWRQGLVVVAAQGELGIGAVAWSRTGDDERCFRY